MAYIPSKKNANTSVYQLFLHKNGDSGCMLLMIFQKSLTSSTQFKGRNIVWDWMSLENVRSPWYGIKIQCVINKCKVLFPKPA